MKQYYFKEIIMCEMCGDATDMHKVLGQRLNQSQGLRPKQKTGISVSVKQCTNCALVYSAPQPIPFDIQDHYEIPAEDYWIPEYFKWTPDYFFRQITTAKKLMSFKNGMKSLDIGSGIGLAMLSMEHAGFDAYGFEPSNSFYEKAISNMNINPDKLMQGMVEEMDYAENTFDFITFGAVFEHIYAPASSLEKAMKWLKPNGIIHIEVPSSNWLIAKFINWYYKLIGTTYVTNLSPMHSPFHLHEFSLTSFQKLAHRLHLTIEYYYFDVGYTSSVPAFLQFFLKKYMKATNTGMQLTVYLKKTDTFNNIKEQ